MNTVSQKPIWNLAVYQGARRAGCSPREAEVLAVFVESRSLAEAADSLNISPHTAKKHLHAVRQRLEVHHIGAAIARILMAL